LSRCRNSTEGDTTKQDSARLFDPSCHGKLEIPPVWVNSNGTVDAGLRPAEARPHDALNGVALTVRNSHQINPHLPLRGRAAHGYRERYLAKEWFGSNRLSKERLQLPAATTTETNPGSIAATTRFIRTNKTGTATRRQLTRGRYRCAKNPEGDRFRLTDSFRNGPIDCAKKTWEGRKRCRKQI
jgi:hypothetical protein